MPSMSSRRHALVPRCGMCRGSYRSRATSMTLLLVVMVLLHRLPSDLLA